MNKRYEIIGTRESKVVQGHMNWSKSEHADSLPEAHRIAWGMLDEWPTVTILDGVQSVGFYAEGRWFPREDQARNKRTST